MPKAHNRSNSSCPATVSDRQLEVLVNIANGMADSEIAGKMLISPHTVVHHVRALQRLLMVNNRPSMISIAVAAGLLDASMWPIVATGSRCALLSPKSCCDASNTR